MAGLTNRGKALLLDYYLRAATAPTSFKIALLKSTATLSADTNVWSDVSGDEIAAGNGYTTGGFALSRNTTDFDVCSEDDTNDRAYIQAKDVTWTASGGPIPSSGAGARYAVLVDNSNNVLGYWDLGANRSVSEDQPLTLQNAELRLDYKAAVGDKVSHPTNQGLFRILNAFFRNTNVPSGFTGKLYTAATAPTVDMDDDSGLTECSGNGYSSKTIARNSTDWPTLTEDDSGDVGKAILLAQVWTASGGDMPSTAARYFGVLDNNSKLTAFWDLNADRQVSDGQTITVSGAEIDITES